MIALYILSTASLLPMDAVTRSMCPSLPTRTSARARPDEHSQQECFLVARSQSGHCLREYTIRSFTRSPLAWAIRTLHSPRRRLPVALGGARAVLRRLTGPLWRQCSRCCLGANLEPLARRVCHLRTLFCSTFLLHWRRGKVTIWLNYAARSSRRQPWPKTSCWNTPRVWSRARWAGD